MTKVSIKNMSASEVRDEDIRIDRELDILRRQSTRFDDEIARLDILLMGWMSRSRAVTRRLSEIATGSEHGVGETQRLVASISKMSQRYASRTDDAMAIYREKDVIYRQQRALYKRLKHVRSRQRELNEAA